MHTFLPLRPPGRPPGQFRANQERLFELLRGAEQPVSLDTKNLATRISASERQVERYLTALKGEQRITIKRSRVNLGQGWANRRFIYVIEE